MNIIFELTMPNCGSWNRIDTGNKEGCFIFKKVDTKTAEKLIGTSHYYNFGDGWGANIKITKGRKCRTNGFRGYDWMVEEIIKYGKIINLTERRFNNKLKKEFEIFIDEFIVKNGVIEATNEFQINELKKIFAEKMYLAKLNKTI